MAKQIKYGRYLHGGDYNPEQWLDRPDILQKDIEYFKKAHINTVSVGIFSWAVLEPEEGKYNFDWLEEIINNLYKEGIHTILATPSGARPKWMADKYEEVLRMDPDRTRRFFGGRHNHCFTSPVYREKVHAIDKKLAERFGKHPAVPHNTTKYTLIKKGDISPFDKLFRKESKKLGWDWRLLAALVYTESQFDPYAESEVGAYGLMQIIPETADHFNVGNYFEPDSNVYVGTEYLHYLDRYFSSQPIDSSERLKFVLAAYNAGPGHVLDAIRLANKYGKDATLWDNNVDYYLLHKNEPEYYRDPLSKNGYCNGRQTYKYVRQVLETYNNYKNIKQ